MPATIRIVSIVATVLVLCILPSLVMAQEVNVFQPSGSSGYYSNEDNWSLEHVPDGDEAVLIPSGKTCNVDKDTQLIQGLEVEPNAYLKILGGYTFKLENPSEPTTSIIDGEIQINQTGPYSGVATLAVIKDFIFTGDGKIIGYAGQSSEIELVSAKLTSAVVVEGALIILGSADTEVDTFVNEAIVHSNSGGTIVINTADVQDVNGALWKASAGSALHWDPDTLNDIVLEGDFVVDTGTLDIDRPAFTTDGGLTCIGEVVIDCSGSVEDAVFLEAGD